MSSCSGLGSGLGLGWLLFTFEAGGCAVLVRWCLPIACTHTGKRRVQVQVCTHTDCGDMRAHARERVKVHSQLAALLAVTVGEHTEASLSLCLSLPRGHSLYIVHSSRAAVGATTEEDRRSSASMTTVVVPDAARPTEKALEPPGAGRKAVPISEAPDWVLHALKCARRSTRLHQRERQRRQPQTQPTRGESRAPPVVCSSRAEEARAADATTVCWCSTRSRG